MILYTDGASRGNPGRAGSGIAVYRNKKLDHLIYGGYSPVATNNMAELVAIITAMQHIINVKDGKSLILSDSMYSIEAVTKWGYGWSKKGWDVKKENLSLIKKGHELYRMNRNSITIQYVKAHVGIEGNELADRMANAAVDRRQSAFVLYENKDILEILKKKYF